MIPKYIDAHCHLQFEQYAQDRDEIIEKMRKEGIGAIVVGTDLASSQEAIALAEKYEHLYASVGLHPSHATQKDFNIEKFKKLAQHSKVVAVGECGLDYFHTEKNDQQEEILKKHITLAAELEKPLIIHARSSTTENAYQDLIQILKKVKIEYPNLRGDIHFFSGSLAEAQTLIALDFTISFTAVITFARTYDEIIKAVPIASILSETDAPYVAPASRRGQRNDPLAIVEVVAMIASIRGEDLEGVRAALLASAQRLLRWS
ncbi:MAG: TatD family hydrolase [Candidatus Paceibacterota bacterium]|jgi:TatD DNase family protein